MDNLDRAAELLLNASRVVCFSGAGISEASGIPTYQHNLTGLWSGLDPRTLETANAYRENPKLVWGWYLWRRRKVLLAQPNAAHLALPSLAGLGREVSVITQNIDDLHERAGSKDVLHLHGSLTTPKCFACHRQSELTSDDLSIPDEGALIEPPRCKRCNGKLRPGVVWYGEDLPTGVWKSALLLVQSCDVFISIGTSGTVTPAADLPGIALSAGAKVIHINTVDVSLGEPNELMLVGRAADILTKLSALALSKVHPS
ncbi:NAD-dependent protein deacylase [compost metagenome]